LTRRSGDLFEAWSFHIDSQDKIGLTKILIILHIDVEIPMTESEYFDAGNRLVGKA